jgi:hypothetical protein
MAHVALVPHDAAPWSGHAVAQHTPFVAQTPLVQSAPPSVGLQPEPLLALPTQAEPAQWLPLAHCALDEQVL